MNWKDVAEKVGAVAPMLGTLVYGPAGGTVGAIIASALGVENKPDAVDKALTIDPQAALKLREIESNERVKLQELATSQAAAQLQAESQAISDVNRTMQAEAAAEHWPTWSWRPFIGYAVGFNVIASSVMVLVIGIGLMLGSAAAATAMAHLPMILGALAGINATVLPILGIASWFRGKMQADPAITTIQLAPGGREKGVPPPPNPFAQ